MHTLYLYSSPTTTVLLYYKNSQICPNFKAFASSTSLFQWLKVSNNWVRSLSLILFLSLFHLLPAGSWSHCSENSLIKTNKKTPNCLIVFLPLPVSKLPPLFSFSLLLFASSSVTCHFMGRASDFEDTPLLLANLASVQSSIVYTASKSESMTSGYLSAMAKVGGDG